MDPSSTHELEEGPVPDGQGSRLWSGTVSSSSTTRKTGGPQVYPGRATVTNLLRIASVSGVSGVAAESSSSVACPVSGR